MWDWLGSIGNWASGLFGGGGENASTDYTRGISLPMSEAARGDYGPSWTSAFESPGTGAPGTATAFDMRSPGGANQLGDSGGGDWWSAIKGGLGSVFGSPGDALSTLGKVGQLGATGMGIAGGIGAQNQAAEQAKLQRQAQRQLTAAAAPAVATGGTLTTAGGQALMGGALPPELEARVQQWKETQLGQIRQQLSHMGITDSTMMKQFEAYIAEQEQVFRGQLAQQLYQSGLGGIQTGTYPEAQVLASAQGQANVDRSALGNLNANIWKTLGVTQ